MRNDDDGETMLSVQRCGVQIQVPKLPDSLDYVDSVDLFCSCSLGCYKKHNETPCAKPDADGSKSEGKVDEEPATVAEDDESSHRLKRSQFEALAASEEVRKMLRDRELQELISKIDSSPNSKVELEKAMEGPAFREFTDKLLLIVNPGDNAPAAQL